MRKLKYLFVVAILALCVSACGGDSDGGKEDSGKGKDKETVSTEKGDGISDADAGEDEQEEKKAPVPSEKYVLYREVHDSGYVETYEYNEKGHPVKSTSVNKAKETTEIVYTYTYNADGSYCVNEDGGRSYNRKYKEYDAKDRVVLLKFSGETTTTSYDEKDRVIEKKVVSDEGRVRSWIKTEYNDAGEVLKESYFYGDGSSAGHYEYEYSETDTIRYSFNEEGELFETDNLVRTAWEYTYDEFDRVIYEARKDVERGGAYEKYTYEYDEAGGMCKKTDEVQNVVYEYKPLSQCIVK